MAFVPEDGTGLENANSLVSLAYADEYFADRGNATWKALSDDKKQSSLILGTAYADTQFSYKGQKLNPDQGTSFPRAGVIDPSGREVKGVPDCVKQVTCELAVRASSRPLIQDPVVDEGGRPVKMKQMRAGPLQKVVEFAGPGEVLAMARYPAVEALMCPWLVNAAVVLNNGVKIASAKVSGVSNERMASVAGSADRYSGPLNENQKDTGDTDGVLPV